MDTSTEIGTQQATVAAIVAGIHRHGYYLAHIEPHPQQRIIDLRWAGQLAGRVLDRKTRCHTSAIGALEPGMVTVVVAQVDARSLEEVRKREDALAVIEDLARRSHPARPSRAIA